MNLDYVKALAKMDGEDLSPDIKPSTNYKTWVSIEDEKRCIVCENNHGKIWKIWEFSLKRPPAHFMCRCRVELLGAITAGTATIKGIDGADWWLKYMGSLPDCYIEKTEALKKGWKPGKWPSNFAPGNLITAGRYYNNNGHLPDAKGRIWYEADINYKSGRRNTQRIVWSNDGLIFVTYDHYGTFYEIV